MVIVDFGLAVYAWEEDYGTYKCGTPGYLSPDIVLQPHKHKLAPKSDIFSAGVVFHVLLMGRYLFEGKDSRAVFDKNKEYKFELERPEYGKLDGSAFDVLKRML
jgi:serine/threonine protein kinase